VYAEPLAAGVPFLVTDPAADPEVLAKTVARRAVVDARHALDADAWRDCGWDYRAPGRSSHPALARHTVDVPPRHTALREAELACLAAAI